MKRPYLWMAADTAGLGIYVALADRHWTMVAACAVSAGLYVWLDRRAT